MLRARLFLPAFLLAVSSVDAADAPKARVVLVEADGRDEEVSAFVARLESELADAAKVSFSDARLAGATLGALQAEPEGEAAKAFREGWPGSVWLALSLSPCRVHVSRMQYSDTTPEGYRVQRVVENVNVLCDATLRLVDAASARERRTLEVEGSAAYKRTVGEDEEPPEVEGARQAAKKAAKKLASELKK